MLQNLLARPWAIWFIYHGQSYEGNVHLITTISSPADLAYFWSHSPIASLSNYFLSEEKKQKAYLIDQKFKQINSIEYFATGIQPKWQDPQNQKGGRFIFQVPKSQQNKKELYERITFFLIGAAFEGSQHVNGFRFISSKNPNEVSFRIEIWVDFNEADTDSIVHFQLILTALFQELHFGVKKILFKQMKDEGTKPVKDQAKNQHKTQHKTYQLKPQTK